ncbi:MAG: amino acid permease [Acidimicrobiaceae bacterium]|nr:amino acid permease [Acidimicrobiaceae bacterium]
MCTLHLTTPGSNGASSAILVEGPSGYWLSIESVSEADKQIAKNSPVLTSHANVANVYPESLGYRIKRVLLGKPYVTEQLSGERLNRAIALGVLAPDCISSSAYGTEQILTQMTPYIGLAAFAMVVPIMFVIIGVLFVVTTSYLDVIKYYTTAGGSYVVARDNFGPKIAQIAAVALLIDYIVTVAVQCSAGTAALTSAVPGLVHYTLWITIAIVVILIYGNLRGLREAGSYFALPTYFYILMLSSTIIIGYYKKFTGTLHMIPQPLNSALVQGHLGQKGSGLLMGLAFITLMRAYANGGSSLTGLEAISNGVASFRRPESPNARKTLVWMASILAFLLLGTTLIASWTHALPYAIGTPTVVSQEVLDIFGSHGLGHYIFYVVQLATVLILYTGGNTSFNGFPFLANYVATDKYLPRQLTKRGHRLAFSNGILLLGAVSLTLIIVFNAQVNGLIALYAIGVFTGFTLAGAGMVARHLRERSGRWRFGVAMNAVSASVTAVVVLVFLVAKFKEGAWIIALVGPLMYVALIRLNKQYVREDKAFEAVSGRFATMRIRMNRVVIFVDNYDLATERALLYCVSLNAYSLRAVHFDIDPIVTKRLERSWGSPGTASANITLETVECDDRRVDRAALELVADVVRDPEVFCMVILPRRGFVSRLQRLLHDRTADAIAGAVMHVPRTAATIVPYRAVRKRLAEGDVQESPVGDEVVRGGLREDAHLEADLKLAERSSGAAPIGGLLERQHVEIAGRVRAMAINHEGEGHELRCVIADNTGSVTLVFQGRSNIPGIERGTRLLVRGTVTSLRREAVILNPQYEIVAAPPSDE